MTRSFRLVAVGLGLSLLLSLPAWGADGARARLQTFAHQLHSLSGHFSQSVAGSNGAPAKTSNGTFALQAPRQFRWDTAKPYHQVIVADGRRVWLFDPELDQVTVRKQSQAEAHSPLTILTDLSRLKTDFSSQETGTRNGLEWLRLTPKASNPKFDYVGLGFNATGLAAMVFRDRLGNVTRIRFSDLKRNPALPADTFRFTPPEGVDVFGDTGGAVEINPLQP